MASPRITLAYSAAGAAGLIEPTLQLEQQPVASGRLTLTDIEAMLALVRSGLSAHHYKPKNCTATVVDGSVLVELVAYVWPSSLALAYTLSSSLSAWMTIGDAVFMDDWREFDLVVPMANHVELPFLIAEQDISWQTPCYNPFSEQVALPEITVDGLTLNLGAEVFGVLRLKCRALGYQHTLSLSIPKLDDAGKLVKVDDIDAALTASWPLSDGTIDTATLDLALPGCVKDLLTACDDGSLRDEVGGKVTKDDPLVPVVYFNACLPENNIIGVAYERP